MAEFIFWFGLATVFYTYLGYGLIITLLAAFTRRNKPETKTESFEPGISFIVAAWNEAAWIRKKAENSLALDYPPERIEFIFVTDGSDDGTPELLEPYDRIKVMHQQERKGKIAAMERAAEKAAHPILIFSDANTTLNNQALRNIVKHYANPEVGAVAGEKRIRMEDEEAASGAGEGLYWKYESYLKKCDYRFYSVVGAAGELFSVRRDLYEPIEPDTLLDDFVISMRVAEKGFRVAYAPDAWAEERPSADVRAEMSRKVRIAAGGIQSVLRLRSLLNPFTNLRLWFLYISHRVLRWTLAPLFLPLIFVTNILLYSDSVIYLIAIILQLMFYTMALLGYILERRKVRVKLLFVPFYFTFMQVCMYLGWWRFSRGKQSVMWVRAERAT